MPSAFSRFKCGLAHGHDLLNLSFLQKKKILLVIKFLKDETSPGFIFGGEGWEKESGGLYDKGLALTLF